LMTWIYTANLIVLTGVELDAAVKELQQGKSVRNERYTPTNSRANASNR